MKYFVRDHCGGLKEAIETTKEITKEEFLTLLYHYHFYAYDHRTNELLWILEGMETMFHKYHVWLGIELD